MPYLDELRGALGAAADGRTDEDLLDLVSRATGRSPGQVANDYGYDPGAGSLTRERLSGGIDRYQAGLYDFGAQVSGAMGFSPVSNWLDERRRANEIQANVAAERASNLGGIDRWADVHGPGDFLNYAGGLAAQSLPYVGEALVGGLGGRAVLGGVRGAMAGGMAATYPSSVGDVLSNQREQSGTTDIGSAMALGVPYAGLNAFGVEGLAARGQLARSGIRALDNLQGARGIAARTGATVARTGLEEGIGETGQEVVNQLGRMAVDPRATLTDPEALDRYRESFIGGATLGGMVGGAGGGWRRSAGYRPALEETGNLLDPSNPVVAVPQGPTPPPAATMMPGVPLTGVAPEVVGQPPVAPAPPAVVAGVDTAATAAATQQKAQENEQAKAEFVQLTGLPKPTGNQVLLYRRARAIRDNFTDEEFSDLVAQIGAGDTALARAEVVRREKSLAKQPKESADAGVGNAPGGVAAGSGDGGSAVAAGGVVNPGQPPAGPAAAGVLPAPLAPVAPGRASLPARVGAVQQPAAVAPAPPAAPVVTVKKTRKLDPATVTKDEVRARLAALSERDKQVVQAALGIDAEGHEVGQPAPYDEIGKAHGISKQRVQMILASVGVNEKTIERFAGAAMESVPLSDLVGGAEEGAATGIRTMERPSEGDDFIEARTDEQKKLESAATKLLKAGKVEPQKLAVPGSRTAEFLARKEAERAAQKKAADEAIERKRQEYADRLKEMAAKVNPDVLTESQDNSPAYEQADIEGAERDWTDSRHKGDAEWADLTKAEQERYVQLYRADFDGKLGERGRDYLDDLFDRTSRDALARKVKKSEPVAKGQARKAGGELNVLNDPDMQRKVVNRAAERGIQRIIGKEVPPAKRISIRSRLNRMLREFDSGKIHGGQLATRVEELSADLEFSAQDRRFTPRDPVRGADYIRERLLQAKRRGDLSERAAEFAEWFVLRNPGLLDNLGVSVRSAKSERAAGTYNPMDEVMTLAKGSSRDEAAVHEMLHHLERMMPEDMQREIRQLWVKALAEQAKAAKEAGETQRLVYFDRALHAVVTGDPKAAQQASDMVAKGEVPYGDYQFLNPSEFWAVNMAAREQARFDARNSLWGRAKLWLKDALEWIKMVLGLNSRTPMVRALREVMDGSGEFQSTSMLAGGEDFNAPERPSDADSNQPPVGKPGSASSGRGNAGLPPPLRPGAAHGQGANGQPVPRQAGVGAGGGQPPNGAQPSGLGNLPPPPGRPAKLKGWIDSVVAGKWRAAPWLLGALSTEQLVERMSGALPPRAAKALQVFHEGMTRMAQRANQIITESDKIKRQWEQLRSKHGMAREQAFMDFMLESTRSQVWAMEPLDQDGPNRHLGKLVEQRDGSKERVYPVEVRMRHAKLAQAWNGLHPDQQAFFRTLQRDFQAKYKAKVEGFRQNIVNGHYPPAGAASGVPKDVIDQAAALQKKDRRAFMKQHGTSKLERDTLRSLWNDLDENFNMFPTQLQGPYFPLMRFGDHIISVKSHAYREAESKLAAANQELEAMLSDKGYKPIGDLEAERDELEDKLAKAKTDPEKLEIRSRLVTIASELEKLNEPLAEKRKERNAARTALGKLKASEQDYVVEFYETLGEATARKEQLDKHFAGNDDIEVAYKLKDQYLREVDGVTPTFLKKVEDHLASDLPAADKALVKRTMRELYLQMLPEHSAMKSQMRRMNVAGVRNDMGLRSYAASSVRDAWYISRLENREPVRASMNELRFSDDVDSKLIGNELAARAAQNFHFDNHQWMGTATNLTYLAYLGMSPAFFVTQITQPWVISAPIMAARHGAQTASQLWRGWRQAGQLMRLNRKSDGSLNYSLDPVAGEKAKILTAGEAAMLSGLLDSGRIDITITHDLGAAAAGRSAGLLGKAVAMSAWPAQQAEILNRVSTALAAYRMEKNRLMKAGTAEAAATTAAREYADRIVSETHLNYAPENRARFMHPNSFGGWGRIMWQFRSYQQGMLYLTLKNLFDAFKGDKEARRAAIYLAGMQLAVAGTSGLPIAFPAGLVATLIYKMLTDDDDEGDLKELYFQSIEAVAGETVATAVVKGLPAAFLGVDMSKRLGMGNIFNPVPYVDDSKEGRDLVASYWVALAGGAPMGYVGNVAEGISAANRGDWAKAFAWAMPFKAAADLARGASQAARGMVDSNGNTVLAPEELGYEDAVLKMLGFPSAQVERTREQRNAFFEARQNRSDARSAIVRELVQSRLKGEAGDTQAMLDYNTRHPDNRITMSDVLRQVKLKRDEARMMQRTGGVPVKKSERGLAREMGLL